MALGDVGADWHEAVSCGMPHFYQVVGATGSTLVTYVLPGACFFFMFPDRPSRSSLRSVLRALYGE